MNRFGVMVVMLAMLAGCSGERQDYQRAETAGTVAAWEEFLVRHPDGERAAAARAQLATLHEEREWKRASTVDSADAYQQYLRGYPNGHYASEALIRIANLNLAATPAGGPDESAPSATTEADVDARAAGTAAAPAGKAAPIERQAAVVQPQPAVVRPAPTPASRPTPAPVAAEQSAVAKTAKPAQGFRVQLGAFATGSAAAERAWKKLQKKYPQQFADRKPIIAAARGRDGKSWHRLQVAGYTGTSARALCAQLKTGGDPCVPVAPAR